MKLFYRDHSCGDHVMGRCLFLKNLHDPLLKLVNIISFSTILMVCSKHWGLIIIYLLVRSGNWGCLVTWFCYQLIAKPGTLGCQIKGPDCLFISYFLPTWPKPYLALRLYFFRGHLAACTKFASDRPTETVKPVHVGYFTCHLWTLSHLFSVYMAVIIHILHDENQFLLKTVVFARRLNQK